MEIGLDGCPNLQIFKAGGSAITGASFAKGARLHTCYLPVSVSTLSLLDLHYLNAEGLHIETNENGKYTFSDIRIENCEQVPFYDIIMNSPYLRYLRLRGLEWHVPLTSDDPSIPNFMSFYNLIQNENLHGLAEDGAQLPDKGPQISGRIYLTEAISEEILEKINELCPELTIVVNDAPQYFLTFKDYNNNVICRYIADEGSTPIDPSQVEIPGVDLTPD
jgi:hypothetical protein